MVLPLVTGVIVGFLMGIPIGPINVWVIKTKMTHGKIAASSLGLAGAIMDGITVFFILSGLQIFQLSLVSTFHWLCVLFFFLGFKEVFKKINLFRQFH